LDKETATQAPATIPAWLNEVVFDERGLVPVIAQDWQTGTVLMVAWANAQALHETVTTRRAVYWSRSRKRLWRKGEESGHVQHLHDIYLDCDGDVILLKVEQVGGIACHTGRHNCFFRRLEESAEQGAAEQCVWNTVAPVLKDPERIYR